MNNFQQKAEQQISLNQPPPHCQFSCNICQHLASQPVVTQCGHLYCWQCIHNHHNCSVCGNKISEDDFLPIYTTYETRGMVRNVTTNKLKPKPKAKQVGKIKNYVALGSGNQFSALFCSLNDNIQRGAMVAGNSYLPATVFNFMGGLNDQHLEEIQIQIQDKYLKSKITIFSWFLLLLVLSSLIVAFSIQDKEGNQ